MRSHVSRQPAGLAIAAFVAALALAVMRSIYAPYPAEASGPTGAPLADLLDKLIPSVAGRYIFTVIILTVNAVLLARVMIIYKATPGRSYLPFVMYAFAATGVFFPVNSLTAPLASLLLVASSEQAVSAFRRRYRFGAVFNSALMLGFIPLLYPPAICLTPILAVTLAIYQRNVREVVVAVTAFLLPWLLCSIGWWFAGYAFGHIGTAFLSGLTESAHLSIPDAIGANTLPVLAFCGIYAAIILISIAMLAARYGQYPNRVRNIYIHFSLLLLCCAGMLLLPSGNPATSAALLAVPASVMATHTVARLKAGPALILYLLLIAGFLGANLAAIL